MLRKIILLIRKKIMKIDDRSQLEIAVSNGLIIGKDCNIQPHCIIDPSHCWLIEIGDRVTLAPRVHILAHDASSKGFLNYTLIAPVKIGSDCFIGAGSIILPGVTIGDNVIIGAGSVVTKSIPDNSIAVGNPARVISSYNDYVLKRKEQFKKAPKFDESYIIGNITNENMEKMRKTLDYSIGFVI